jgi:spore germination protein KA
LSEILSGNTGLFIEGSDSCIFSETKGFDKRGVEKPLLEGVVKGPQEAFNENIRTNVTLVRKIIKDSSLTTEFLTIGDRNKNLCAVMYMEGLINPTIVAEVKRRISGLKADFIFGEGMLEQFIEDNPMSLMPSTLSTERPDRTASHILEGKVAIIVEGTPSAIIVPITLPSLMFTSEDTNLKWQFGTALRFIRTMALLISVLLPSIYIAVTNFHHEMLPTDLLIAIAKAKENVPFPTMVEILLMELSFELIREAGIRIPGLIGNTIGIIGALILGQAAVTANLVSPILIIIVAFSGLGNFAIPNFSVAFAARLLRFGFILVSALLGFYGISLLLITTIAIICHSRSFGVPMLSSITPKARKSFDLFIRWPVWKQEWRPDYTNSLDKIRQPIISRTWTEEKEMEDQNVRRK